MSQCASHLPVASSKGITLFCIPHAGGSAGYYTNFCTLFPAAIRPRPLELAGRGRRCKEPLETGLDSIGRDLFSLILPVARTSPYALFGHSMGALLAFLCAVQAYENGVPLPQALFISACPPPADFPPSPATPPPALSPGDAWREAIELGGIPEGIMHLPEFRKYLEPILHADLTAMRTWRPHDFPALPVPITVFLGNQDKVTAEKGCDWARLTTREFALLFFDGGHFYLQNHGKTLAAHIAQTLSMLA